MAQVQSSLHKHHIEACHGRVGKATHTVNLTANSLRAFNADISAEWLISDVMKAETYSSMLSGKRTW
jgi:hypothetical protein